MEKPEFDISSLPLSASVRKALAALPPGEPVCSWTIVEKILELHPEYGKKRGGYLLKRGGPPDPGFSQPVGEWFRSLADLFRIEVLSDRGAYLDGRLTIWGLAQLDPALKGYLDASDLLAPLEQEYEKEKGLSVESLLRRQPGSETMPSPNQSAAQSSIPATPPFDEEAETKRVRSIRDPSARMDAYLELLPRLPSPRRESVADHAWADAREIKDAAAYLSAVVSLLPYLPEDSRGSYAAEATSALSALSDPAARLRARLGLLPYIPETARESLALAGPEEIKALSDPSAQVQAWTELLPHLPGDMRAARVGEALMLARNMPDPTLQSSFALALLQYLPEAERGPALARAGLPETMAGPEASTPVSARRMAGYRSDYVSTEQPDLLDITQEVENIASVLVYRDVQPPLALGLFGDWGSGKSFFIGKLQECVEEIAEGCRGEEATSKVEGKWCTRVAQIDFNAWHFSDANLWASLVTRIYEGLDQELNEQKKVSEKLKREIVEKRVQEAQDRTIEAEVRLGEAQRQVSSAEENLKAKTDERERQENELSNMLNNVQDLLLDDRKVSASLDTAAQALRVPEATRDYQALEQLGGELQTLSGRVTAVTADLLHSPGSIQLMVLLVLVVPVILVFVVEQWLGFLTEGGKRVAEVSALLFPMLGWLRMQVQRGLALVSQVETALARARAKREDRIQNSEPVLVAKQALAQAQTEEQAARANLEAAQAELQHLRDELHELRPERRLLRLIESRAVSGAYTQHLSIISMIRSDFESMSEILDNMVTEHPRTLEQLPKLREQLQEKQADCDRMKADHDKLVADLARLRAKYEEQDASHKALLTRQKKLQRNRPTQEEADQDEQAVQKAAADVRQHQQMVAAQAAAVDKAEQERKLVEEQVAEGEEQVKKPPIQRIILYIDDLDRCRPERVVEVLEAVHLLLYFKLFVVVVAVDPRWLRHSLYKHYPATLSESGGLRSVDGRLEMAPYSTPQDYLEKIFQIPFALRPVEQSGYKNLVDDLLKPLPERRAQAETAAAVSREGGPGKAATGTGEPAGQVQRGKPTGGIQGTAPGPVTARPARRRTPAEQLEFKEWEKQHIERLWRMFRTPRTVKRFINIYRLLRAGLATPKEVQAFEGEGGTSGEYQVALLLLAAITGFPNEASRFLFRVDAWLDDREREPQPKAKDGRARPERTHTWQSLIDCLKEPLTSEREKALAEVKRRQAALPQPEKAGPRRPAEALAPVASGPEPADESESDGAESWGALLQSLERVIEEKDGQWNPTFKASALRHWTTRAARFSFCVQPT